VIAVSESRLHLLLAPSALDDCLPQVAPGDRVVLLDRGVELVTDARALDRLAGRASELLVSAEDRRARGLPLPDGLAGTDDRGIVDLVARHRDVLSWS